MSDSAVLVTGAGGFVGRALLRELRNAGRPPRVVAADLQVPRLEVTDAEWRCLDLTDRPAVRDLLDAVRPEVVFHLGGLARGDDWDALYAANVSTTVVLLECIMEVVPECVTVIPGSAAEYGPVPAEHLPVAESEPLRPISHYGVSKVWQTVAGLSFVAQGLDVRVARLFNMIGPGLPATFALSAFARQLKEIVTADGPGVIDTGYLGSQRDFLDVSDVAAGLLAVATRGSAGETYNVCSGIGVSMKECLDILIETAGVEVAVSSRPANDSSAILDSVGSNRKLIDASGWEPSRTVVESIAAFWAGL